MSNGYTTICAARTRLAAVAATVILVAINYLPNASATEVSAASSSSNTKQETQMFNVTLGEHTKMAVLRTDRQRIQEFYRDVLGCKITKTSDAADVFQVGPSFYLGAIYGDTALSAEEMRKSIWLELKTDHLEELKRKIRDFGIEPLEYWDKSHFYFQAPGGQVFRLIDSNEDMSKWQR